jgi:hypothetical protein
MGSQYLFKIVSSLLSVELAERLDRSGAGRQVKHWKG